MKPLHYFTAMTPMQYHLVFQGQGVAAALCRIDNRRLKAEVYREINIHRMVQNTNERGSSFEGMALRLHSP